MILNMDKNKLLVILPILIFILMIAIIVILIVGNDQNSDPRIDNSAGIQCVQGGCSGQLCVENGTNEIVTTCEWKDEYQCFNDALCEVQDDGKCGWTLTAEYEACLEFITGNK